MNNIKLLVQTTTDKSSVVVCAQTVAAGDIEDRNYFLNPAVAVDVANSILHAAEECGVEVNVQSMGVTDMQRLQLIARTGHIMRTMSGKKVEKVALQVVDSILAEIL